VARADLARLLGGTPPILLDEWQYVPESWDLVRRAVDENPAAGRFLLTGSATPVDQPTHSGAGRITTIRMRPLSLVERSLAKPTVRLSSLLAADRAPIQGETDVTLEHYIDEIVASGFPGMREMGGRARRAQLDGYIGRIIEHDFEEMGNPVRNEGALRRWMTAYAAATSTTASFETIRDAATSGQGEKPSKPTVIPYRNTLERLWIVDEVPAWLPSRNHIRRLGEAPKHQLADPALAARLLGVGPDALLDGRSIGPSIPRDGTLLGALFDSLVT
jgi:predicted AAA+ superfamily ATPase